MKNFKFYATLIVAAAVVCILVLLLWKKSPDSTEPTAPATNIVKNPVESVVSPANDYGTEPVSTQQTPIVSISTSQTDDPFRVAMKYDMTLDQILGGNDPMPDFDLDGLINETLQAFRKNASKEEKLALMRKIEDITHPIVIPVILEALKDPDPEIQQAALEALRFIDDPAVIPAVLLALDNKDPLVREDAVSCLLEVKDESINQVLIRAAKDPDKNVRDEVLNVLMMQAEPYVLPALKEIITYEDKQIQTEVVSVLEEVPAPAAIDLLINDGLLSDYDEVRAATVDVLRDMSGKEFTSHEQWQKWWSTVKDSVPAKGDREIWETWWYRYANGIKN